MAPVRGAARATAPHTAIALDLVTKSRLVRARVPRARAFLWQFEEALRSAGDGKQFKCVTLPYWDWAHDVAKSSAVHSDAAEWKAVLGRSLLFRDMGCVNEQGTLQEGTPPDLARPKTNA